MKDRFDNVDGERRRLEQEIGRLREERDHL